jgi:Pro-kumamolisin, activation domain/Bacterial Ig-like domain (group 3)
MKTNRFKLCSTTSTTASLLALALWCAGISVPTADAQAAAQATSSQTTSPRVPARITQTVDDTNLKALRGNVHRLARSEFDRGAVPDSQLANHMVLLLQRSTEQQASLKQLLTDQQDKSSKNYHAWLTPDQFGKQFGPADSDIQAITDWLTSRGFAEIKVSPSHTRIEFSGNIGQVRNSFHTEIHHFLVNGQMHMANVSEPQIPVALAPVVRGVLALHDFRPKARSRRRGTFRRTKATGEVKPLFTFNGCGGPCYTVGPGDFAKIYSLPPTTTADGTGVTIAIVQDSNINVADVAAYRTLFGLPNPTTKFTTSNIILNGPDPGIQGPDSLTDDEFEADLDVQLAGGVAPGATVDLVVSENSISMGAAGVDLSAIYIIDNNSAPILSESFGFCEPNIGASSESFYDDLWQQAAAEGITVILPAGDSGSDSCDQGNDFSTTGLSVSGIASTPYNVAVGGTDFRNGSVPSVFWNATNTSTTNASALGYVPESTWNDSCASGATTGVLTTCTAAIINQDSGTGDDTVAGGGGPSTLTVASVPVNAKPTWQMGTNGNPADGVRDLPDISLFAGDGINGSFYVICQQDQNALDGGTAGTCDLNSPFLDFQGVGGTSAGAPAFAGIMALVNQKTGQRQGNANFVLYQLYKNNPTKICASAANPASTCIFYDLVAGAGNISVACQGGTPNCSNTSTAANQYGVLVDPAHPTVPAWSTTAGYDLATGLGSLNVANLLTAWSSATFTGSTIAINCVAAGTSCTTTSPVSIVHGADVTFTVGVTPTTATGAISLLASPAGQAPVAIGGFSESAASAFQLSSGAATITTNGLPGGASYPVVAHYGGDGTVAAGTSAPVNVTVTPEASKTVVSVVTSDNSGNITSSNAATAPYGSAYIVQIAVQDSAGNQCANVVVQCPTGTVTLKDNSSAVNDFSGSNSAKLSNLGIAEDQPVQFAVGIHSLTSTYSGDNSYTASTSAADAFTVTKATPTGVTVAPSTPTVAANQNVGLVANISTLSSGAGPTGMVTFSSGSTTLGTANVLPAPASGLNGPSPTPASGTATLTTKFATAGPHSFTATYAGDTNYNSVGPSAAGNITVTSGAAVTTTAVTSNATSISSGSTVKLTATVTSNATTGPNLSNTVQFFSGTTLLGNAVTCVPVGVATPTCSAVLNTSSLPSGTDSITASYNGDTNYAASTSPAITVTVTGATSTTILISNATSVTSGGSVILTASVSAAFKGGPAMTGTVQFMNGTTAIGSPVPCAARAGDLNTPATCLATLTTNLSMLAPQTTPRRTPFGPLASPSNVPIIPLYIGAVLAALLAFLIRGHHAPAGRRLSYACAALLVFACVAAGIAGCGGGGSSTPITPTPPPPTTTTDSITAVYSGDSTYSGSTSTAVSITIQ